MGNTFHRKREYEDAKRWYEKAISLNSKQAKYYNELGHVLYQLNQDALAVKQYRIAIRLESDDSKKAEYYDNLGKALYYLSRQEVNSRLAERYYTQAIEALTTATQLNPVKPEYQQHLKVARERLAEVL